VLGQNETRVVPYSGNVQRRFVGRRLDAARRVLYACYAMRIRSTIPRRREPVASLCFGFAGLESMMKMLRIDQLRPTQMTYGMREVREKTEKSCSVAARPDRIAMTSSSRW
jgi:hypothetical protein